MTTNTDLAKAQGAMPELLKQLQMIVQEAMLNGRNNNIRSVQMGRLLENFESTTQAAIEQAAGAVTDRVVQSHREGVYESLLKQAVRQLKAWHAKYGAHGPSWIPPGGDVNLMELIDDWLNSAPDYPIPPALAATPDTAPMYKALMSARIALLAHTSGAGIQALTLIDAVLNAAPAIAEVGKAEFYEWFELNYPSDTIIQDPHWHSPRIWRVAQRLATPVVVQPTPSAVDAAPKNDLLIPFRLLDAELPELGDFSLSYGGQWSSDWCVTLNSIGGASVTRLTVSKNKKEAIEAGDFSRYRLWVQPEGESAVIAWAYKKDVKDRIDAAILAATAGSAVSGGRVES